MTMYIDERNELETVYKVREIKELEIVRFWGLCQKSWLYVMYYKNRSVVSFSMFSEDEIVNFINGGEF